MRRRPLALTSLPLVFLGIIPVPAHGAKTSDLLILSGARSVQKFKNGDEKRIGANELFIATGTIQLVRRRSPPVALPPNTKRPATPPLLVSVSVRGIPEAGLFPIDPHSPAPDPLAACGAPRRLWVDVDMAADPVTLGYIACFPADRLDKTQGQILVAAGGADPETIPIAFERPEGFFDLPFLNALLSPALAGLSGLVGGTVIAFLGFLAQQRFLRRREEAKAFRERKNQSIRKVRDFFRDIYPVYRNDPKHDEPTKLNDLRESLINRDIYAILAPEQIARLEHLFNRNRSWPFQRSRLDSLDQLMKDNFGEFMLPENKP